jgi:hypothetical protein
VIKQRTYPIIGVLAFLLIAPSFSAFGQRGERGRFEERTPLRVPVPQRSPLRHVPNQQIIRAPEQQTTVRRIRSAAVFILVNARGGTVAGVRRRAMACIAGGGMLVDSGISTLPIRSEISPKNRPTTCPRLRLRMGLRMIRRLHQWLRRPRENPGTRYQTLKECEQVREQAGSGECVWK